MATKMVSHAEEGISDTIYVMFLLKHTLCGLRDWALEAQQQEEEEDLLLSEGQQEPFFSYCLHFCKAKTAEVYEEEEKGLGAAVKRKRKLGSVLGDFPTFQP